MLKAQVCPNASGGFDRVYCLIVENYAAEGTGLAIRRSVYMSIGEKYLAALVR